MRHEIDTRSIKTNAHVFYSDFCAYYDYGKFNDNDLDVLVNEEFIYLNAPTFLELKGVIDKYFYEKDYFKINVYYEVNLHVKQFNEIVEYIIGSLRRAVSIWNYLAYEQILGLFGYDITDISSASEKLKYYPTHYYHLATTNSLRHICYEVERINSELKQVIPKEIALNQIKRKCAYRGEVKGDALTKKINMYIDAFIGLQMFGINESDKIIKGGVDNE